MKFISLASLYTLWSHLISLEAQQQHISPLYCDSLWFPADPSGAAAGLNAMLIYRCTAQVPSWSSYVWFLSSRAGGRWNIHGSLAPEWIFLMQSCYPCHAQTFQVSTNAQPEDIIAVFMVNVILIWLSWQMNFKSVLLCVGATAAVAAFLGDKKCCTLGSLEI